MDFAKGNGRAAREINHGRVVGRHKGGETLLMVPAYRIARVELEGKVPFISDGLLARVIHQFDLGLDRGRLRHLENSIIKGGQERNLFLFQGMEFRDDGLRGIIHVALDGK